MTSFDVLILNAQFRQSLVSTRSLGRHGLRVAAAGPHPNLPTFASRWCGQSFVFPAEETPDSYLAGLENWLERSQARALIPSHDGTIALLRSHRARLEQRVRLALADEAALAIAVDKTQTLAAAQRLGAKIPPQFVVRTASDVAKAMREIGLPAVSKPAESWMQNGGEVVRMGPQLVTTAGEARQSLEGIIRVGGAALFQPLLTGRREAVSLLYAGGEVYARFAQWAKRTRPPLGGESVLRQSIAVPSDIGPQAEALVREINLEGYSEIEYRRDDRGVPYLMEINPRLSASVEIAVRAGVDFPYLLYLWASGERIPRVTGYRTGGWMRHLGADIEVMRTMLEQPGRPGNSPAIQAVLDFGLSFLRPMSYDYFDWQDPLPAVRATTDFAGDMMKRLLYRSRRKRS